MLTKVSNRVTEPEQTKDRGCIVRRIIATIAVVAGIICVIGDPEYLLPLLPVEALIAFELIFWNDCAVRRRNGPPR